MPYSKAHKENTRLNILESAQSLFAEKGFDAVTVDVVMSNCSLTRGAFYAHFKSKSDLYSEALKFSATHSELGKTKPEAMSSKKWLGELLNAYLSLEHVNGERPCPLAFLATDIISRDKITRKIYANTYIKMNKIILKYAGDDSPCNEDNIFSITSMIIGAVAISRTLEDNNLIKNILYSCRQQVRLMLGGI